ncbi:MAG TPA: MoaD/ThiS family protein [Pirellulales bacterium]|nr:MoaD/ThiS family protein [Pirellulales bacterium]
MDDTVRSVRVLIPAALETLLSGRGGRQRSELCLTAANVRGLLAELERAEPQVYVRLCDERGEPRPHVNVFVNDDHVRARAGLDTPLATGDLVSILPAVSGG